MTDTVSQPVHPDLSLLGTAGSYLVMFSRDEVDQEGVLVFLTGADNSSRHLLTSSTLAAPVLQKIILQHPGTGVKDEPPVLPALHHVGEL